MPTTGYFRTPDIHGDTVAFVTEDDLWVVPSSGGAAVRLTANRGEVARPAISPDGAWIAFSSREEGHLEVFVMPSTGGQPRRLTYLGANSTVADWTPGGEIVFRSDARSAFAKHFELWSVGLRDVQPSRLPLGLAHEIAYGPGDAVALGRNTVDPARWKRYRGGTAGHLWVDARGTGTFKRLEKLEGNIAHPMWIGKRIFFVADHEGTGNIYSCTPDGKNLRRHTDHDRFYARFARSDGRRIVYQHAAELWLLDPDGGARPIEIDLPSSRTQRNRKFVDAKTYLQGVTLHPDGHSLAIESRGRLYTMPLWEGAVREFGEAHGVRYRLGQWLHDGERVAVLSDAGGEEALELHHTDGSVKRLKPDVGRAVSMLANPKRELLAISNHRQEVVVVDLTAGSTQVIEASTFGRVTDLAWSPDGRWLAYAIPVSTRSTAIKLWEEGTSKTHLATSADFRDHSPSFDPEGKYLAFLSYRTFDPVYDAHYFDLGFPKGARPYLITLRADQRSPLVPDPKGLGDGDDKNGDDKSGNNKKDAGGTKKEPAPEVKIDLDGIADRIVALPVPEGEYHQIAAIKGKVLYTSFPVMGSLNMSWYEDDEAPGSLDVYDLEELKHESLIAGIRDFVLARDGATMVIRTNRGLRAVKAGQRPDDKTDRDPPSRRSGWIDLGRLRVSVDPGAEWAQMLGEIFRLQRDHYWTPGMSGIEWAKVYERYEPLVAKVATRLEFSDLVWEFQGELGTSHAYEIGGDHRPPPHYEVGYLGADVSFDGRRWVIERIVRGDAWDETRTSPLLAPGARIGDGDTILAVNGRSVSREVPPQALLVNQAGQTVQLTVGDARGRRPRTVNVKTLRNETPARYREWVERNRAHVHEATRGRVGYVHIPDMGPHGWAEFHRYYQIEVQRDGLIVDARFNGGGHVSEIILEKLARKRISYGVSRWGVPEAYPQDSVFGPMVALTNEHAGSDGDIFTHAFKLMDLGPVVGKRTWGGIVGIWPRHRLADNSVTTQPEFHSWFVDVGWGLENYGTDPDHDVDIAPHDYAAGRDPQMAKALELVTKALKQNPPRMPSFPKAPSLRAPKLPKR